MATLREYFDADFAYAARVHVRSVDQPDIEAVLLYDFAARSAFLACYVPGSSHAIEFFLKLLEAFQFGKSKINLDGRVTLPSSRAFPGKLQVRNENPFEMRAQFHGDPEWVSTKDIPASSRIFVYSETALTTEGVEALKKRGCELGQHVQFRATDHATIRSKFEKPLAFICHDARDKVAVAGKVAHGLQRLMCPVWYDEFSLKVGDNLRDNIEQGLKSCKKCVLILSVNFFGNKGWTKKEFDSIFTREIIEARNLVLPIWYGVTKDDVFSYSPSLLNVKGLDWQQLGESEVCRQLCNAILDQEH